MCPQRLLERADHLWTFLDWFMWSADFHSFAGQPTGIKSWPRRGDVMRQDSRLVQAADLLLGEWPYVPSGEKQKVGKADG